jgi:glyceraldehyde-3-phosphate dehydrogenase (ferredoxin)
MIPEVIDRLYGLKDRFQQAMNMTASRINSRNSAAPWESGRNADFVYHFLKRKVDVEKSDDLELTTWVKYFEQDPTEGGLAFWFETLKGIHESLREF